MPKIPQPAEPARPARGRVRKPVGASLGTSGGTPVAGVEPPTPGHAYPAATPSQQSTDPGPLADTSRGFGPGGPCGHPGDTDLPCLGHREGIEADNVLTCADAYYVSMFARIGAYRAIKVLVARFLDGLDLRPGDLRDKLCIYIRSKPLRLVPEDRNRGILGIAGDAALERLLVRFSDAMITWDLSRGPTVALTQSRRPLPEPAARLAVLAAIEDLLLFLDDAGGGGGGLVTHEAVKELVEIFAIFGEPQLRLHVATDDGDDILDVIRGLLAGENDRPTEVETRQMARMACSARKIFQEIAPTRSMTASAGMTEPSDGDLERVGALVYEWEAARASRDGEVAGDPGADEEAEDENRLRVIRLRHRAS